MRNTIIAIAMLPTAGVAPAVAAADLAVICTGACRAIVETLAARAFLAFWASPNATAEIEDAGMRQPARRWAPSPG
jgi:hypothetical protein